MTARPRLTSGKRLFALTLLLTLIGIVVVFEASVAEAGALFDDKYYFIRQQLKWLTIGYAALITCSLIPHTVWKKMGPFIYIAGIVTLIAVLIPGIGVEVKGATRWLGVGGFRFQPVELMKAGIIMFFASWLSEHQRLGPFLTFSLLPVVLVMLQPDLGSTLVVLTISFGMYIAAGGRAVTIGTLATIGIAAVALLIAVSPYRRERVQTFLSPESDPLDSGYHIRQITLALGNGGLFGQGIGQSRQKYQYIPEVSTDSIFAIVAEETGFVGSTILIGLLAGYLHLSFSIAKSLPEHSTEQLIATGLSMWIATHMLLNLAAVVALVPLTGIPLPFISRGGSSLVTMLAATGILIALSRAGEGTARSTPRPTLRKNVPAITRSSSRV